MNHEEQKLMDEAALIAFGGILACPAEAGDASTAASQAWDCAEAFVAERKRRKDKTDVVPVVRDGDAEIIT